MASKKYYERLLIVVGMLFVFFVITMITVPLLLDLFNLDRETRGEMLLLSVYQAVIMFICPSLIAARIVSRKPFSFVSLSTAPTWLSLIGVVFAYCMALPALNQIIFWNDNIVFPDSIAYIGELLREMEDAANASSRLMLATNSWGGLFVNLAIIALLTAFGEEIYFRGTLQNAAASSGANHTAIWVVAFFFSVMHFQAFGFIPRLLMGAWFGYLLYWTRSLYVPIFAHFINNGVVVVCSWLGNRGASYDWDNIGVSEFGFPMAAFVSALAFIIFIVYFRNFFFHCEKKDKQELELKEDIDFAEE